MRRSGTGVSSYFPKVLIPVGLLLKSLFRLSKKFFELPDMDLMTVRRVSMFIRQVNT